MPAPPKPSREPEPSRAARVGWVLLALAGLAFMAALFAPKAESIARGQNDFLPLYVAARLAPSGDLYSPEPYADLLAERFGVVSPSLRYSRPPFYALLLKPLAWLSYDAAYALWGVLRLAAVAAIALVWRGPGRWRVAAAICWSLPLISALLNGQDAVFLPLILAGACVLYHRQPFAAGLLLSLCSVKFHLFLALPLVFLRRDAGALLRGLACGALAAVVLSFWAAGPTWPLDYLRLLTDAEVMQVGLATDRSLMPNLHGLVGSLPLGDWLEWALAAGVFVATALVAPRLPFEPALAATTAAGVLISYHAFVADWSLLVFAGLAMWRRLPPSSPARLLVLALFAPPLVFLQTQPPPYSAVPAAVLLLAWAGFLLESRKPTAPRPAAAT